MRNDCVMKVSVIIPNYNHENFLKRRIESVIAQTWEDIEIIILDDCSTDNSRSVIEQYRSNPKVHKIIYNDTNGGSGFKQWLKGIHAAQGELVWIAESDDWCEINFLEVVVTGMHRNPGCVLAYVQSYCVDDNAHINWQSHNDIAEEIINGKYFFQHRLAYGCTIFNASMAVFKRAYALKVPHLFTEFKLCGDWYFWINIVRFGDVFISNQVLNYYRRTDSSLTSRFYATGYNFIEELRMFQLVKEQQLDDVSFIHDSVYNRYNSFRRKKNKLAVEVAVEIESAFYRFFDSLFLFYLFLLYKRMLLILRKIRLRTRMIFHKIKVFKT